MDRDACSLPDVASRDAAVPLGIITVNQTLTEAAPLGLVDAVVGATVARAGHGTDA
jgi:hypothetical protein